MASSDRTSPSPISGVRLATAIADVKNIAQSDPNKKLSADLLLIEAQAGSSIAATFTQNRFEAAPVTLARANASSRNASQTSYLLINSGNANAGTGKAGMQAALACCEAVASNANVNLENVLPFSTGVIGEALPTDRIIEAVPELFEGLGVENWRDAAHAIMTTDTVAKFDSVSFELSGKSYTISGISKGAGMIMPNMATMLCYMAMDVAIEQDVLQTLLSEAVDASFNRITVDGDTSTNDACVLIASGDTNEHRVSSEDHSDIEVLRRAINQLSLSLAQQIIEDAEGATKLVTIQVDGGASERDCLNVAYTIAHSPLVKTALYASDPNWGRILAAVGRAPIARLDVDAVSIYLDDVLIAERGAVAESYDEQAATAVMQKPDYTLRVDLGDGECSEAIWTCDLSHDYVSINADYRS